jgi:hypothetical protein
MMAACFCRSLKTRPRQLAKPQQTAPWQFFLHLHASICQLRNNNIPKCDSIDIGH